MSFNISNAISKSFPSEKLCLNSFTNKACYMSKPLLSAAQLYCQKITCLLLTFFLPLFLLARTSPPSVSGIVTDSKSNPLFGVSVLVKGTAKGTTTGTDGRFVLNDVPDNGVLVFSSTGFTTQEVSLKGKTSINLSLQESASALNEIVVIGYGTRQKKDVTGAVSQVKVTQLENENPSSVQDALRGNVPGVVVTSSPNAKGGGNLQIRGKSSISGVTSPLIVLDGVIYQGDLSDINPNDIATID